MGPRPVTDLKHAEEWPSPSADLELDALRDSDAGDWVDCSPGPMLPPLSPEQRREVVIRALALLEGWR